LVAYGFGATKKKGPVDTRPRFGRDSYSPAVLHQQHLVADTNDWRIPNFSMPWPVCLQGVPGKAIMGVA
jgi:hypothetical protein